MALVSKRLSDLESLTDKFWEFNDGDTAPGHIEIDPVTGLPKTQVVLLPFSFFKPSITAHGGAVQYVGTDAFVDNMDGTQSGLKFSVAASAQLATGHSIVMGIVGNIFGLRIDESTDYTKKPIGCMIDGIAYNIPNPTVRNMRSQADQDDYWRGFWNTVVATDLGDGPHTVELYMQGDKSVTVSYRLRGVIVEERAGYRPLPRGVNSSGVATAVPPDTTTVRQVSISLSYMGARKLFFINTTGANATIGLYRDAATANPFWQRVVPAGDTVEFDPGGPMYVLPYYKVSNVGLLVSYMGQS